MKKKRDPIAKDLHTPKYRRRVVPNKKRKALVKGDPDSAHPEDYTSELD